MIDGYCDERFYEAKELFSKSIESGFELGAAITLEIEGETVIDLWGVSLIKSYFTSFCRLCSRHCICNCWIHSTLRTSSNGIR